MRFSECMQAPRRQKKMTFAAFFVSFSIITNAQCSWLVGTQHPFLILAASSYGRFKGKSKLMISPESIFCSNCDAAIPLLTCCNVINHIYRLPPLTDTRSPLAFPQYAILFAPLQHKSKTENAKNEGGCFQPIEKHPSIISSSSPRRNLDIPGQAVSLPHS